MIQSSRVYILSASEDTVDVFIATVKEDQYHQSFFRNSAFIIPSNKQVATTIWNRHRYG
jgi:hypothetical protein